MSSQLTPHLTVSIHERLAPHAAFAALRRAAIRMRAARLVDDMVGELVAPRRTTAPGTPSFVRLAALQERYAAFGGDPDDLVR